MDDKEKYKDALERALKLRVQNPFDTVGQMVEYIFPELAESEDERVRNGLITLLKFGLEDNSAIAPGFNVTKEQALAWLEKQGESNSQTILTIPKFTFNDVLALQCCMETVKKVQEDKELYEKLNDLHSKVYDSYQLEKQGDKKNTCKREIDDAYLQGICDAICEIKKQDESTITNIEIPFGANDSELQEVSYYIPEGFNAEIKDDRVVIKKNELKFHIGEWIVDNCGYVWKIKGIGNQFYLLEGVEGDESHPTIEWINKNFHLWSIADAKDGDVLAAHECFVMFKKLDGLNIKCYCTYHYMNNPSFHVDTLHNKDAFHPATKEQSDTLMKAMADAGWTFDFEKKELWHDCCDIG